MYVCTYIAILRPACNALSSTASYKSNENIQHGHYAYLTSITWTLITFCAFILLQNIIETYSESNNHSQSPFSNLNPLNYAVMRVIKTFENRM